MSRVIIGKTGLEVEKNGFGALPVQRVSKEDGVKLLRRAYEGGMNYFDSARCYSDSEEKIGLAFEGMRDKVIIATKTMCSNVDEFRFDLETSLKMLRTDHIDLYQFHNPPKCPRPGDGSGLYEAMLEAKAQGKIRHIGITNHRMDVARDAVESGLYETLQYPFSYLCTDDEMKLMKECTASGMGFIAMKALSGGLINNSAAAAAWMELQPQVIPIWGIQRESELDEFIEHIKNPPALTPELQAVIDTDLTQLKGNFCRACGYCMPCPQGIIINTAARMSLLLRRAPVEMSLNANGKAIMEKVKDCVNCGRCASRCPYGLDTPSLLRRNYKDFMEILDGKPILPHNF